MKIKFLFLYSTLILISSCKTHINGTSKELLMAQSTLYSLYKYYGVVDSPLLRKTYPFDNEHKATYLVSKWLLTQTATIEMYARITYTN